MRRTIVVGLSVLLLSGCAASSPPVSVPAASASSATAAPGYSDLLTELPGTGSHVAGVDFQPGTYAEVEPAPNCEWFIGVDGKLFGSGTDDSILLEDGDTFETQACSVWKKID